MFNFDKALSDIFDRRVSAGKLSLEEEREALHEAKAGAEAATLKLLYAYAYALRGVAGDYRHAAGLRAAGPRDIHVSDDLRMAAVEGFLEALYAFDLDGAHSRLAATVEGYIANSLSRAVVAPVAVSVPERTLKRFYAILRKAEGDPVRGAAMAPHFSMTEETFDSVLKAVRNVQSLDGPAGGPAGGPGGHSPDRLDFSAVTGQDYLNDIEDRLLVEAAFAAVDDLEEEVCRLAYGFGDSDPIPDAEVGHRLGLSRPKVQRVRASALGKMHNAIG
jgi:DNA-directed RNA polymerase specialized sigma subunit